MTKYLSEKALQNLKKYKYKGGEYSAMDNFLNPFWLKVVELLPMWMAPNLVTLIGFSVLIMSTISYLIYDYTMAKEFDPFLYYMSALAIFIYQTLDAVDGK